MAPALYYNIFSPPVRCVMMTAREIGLELDMKNLEVFRGEHLSKSYAAINPQQTIPTLVEEDGFTLWDSHAIATYLIEKYAKNCKLYPKDLRIRAKVDQRLHFDGSLMFPVGSGFLKDVLFYGATAPSELALEKIKQIYGWLEAFLVEAGGDWMVGEWMTVADLSISAILASLHEFHPMDLEKTPKLMAYLERMRLLPYFNEINGTGIAYLKEVMDGAIEKNKAKEAK